MDTNNIFEQEFHIQSYLIDNKSQLSAQDLLRLMQEVAWAHVDKHNIGWDYLYQFNQFWAIARMHVKIIRMPKWHEKVILRTWGKVSEHVTYYRDHEMIDENGNIIVATTSTWAILDYATGRPQKVENFPTHLFVNDQRHAIVENAPKVKAIPFPEEERMYQPVLFSNLDVNQHVNNSKYLQFAIDAFDIEYIQTHRLKEVFINFIRQAKQGDYYAVQYKEIEPNNFITGIYSKEGQCELARVQTIWEL